MHTYLIALGSNIRHVDFGNPRQVVDAAMTVVGLLGDNPLLSDIIESKALGPSRRRYANAAMILDSDLAPDIMLDALQSIERAWGVRRGQRWSARVLDLDIILWTGGIHAGPNLSIPHPRFRERAFVLGPAIQVAPDWIDPIANLSLRQLKVRLTKPRPVPR